MKERGFIFSKPGGFSKELDPERQVQPVALTEFPSKVRSLRSEWSRKGPLKKGVLVIGSHLPDIEEDKVRRGTCPRLHSTVGGLGLFQNNEMASQKSRTSGRC